MAAKTFEEWVKTESAKCRGIDNNSVGQIIWNAATEAAEEKFTSNNKQSTPCCHVCGKKLETVYMCPDGNCYSHVGE